MIEITLLVLVPVLIAIIYAECMARQVDRYRCIECGSIVQKQFTLCTDCQHHYAQQPYIPAQIKERNHEN